MSQLTLFIYSIYSCNKTHSQIIQSIYQYYLLILILIYIADCENDIEMAIHPDVLDEDPLDLD